MIYFKGADAMIEIRRTSAKSPAFLKHKEHQELWRMVESAVVDAMKMHPDYTTEKGRNSMVQSITKRVVGMLVHNAKRTRKGGRLGGCSSEALSKPGTDDTSPILARGGSMGRGCSPRFGGDATSTGSPPSCYGEAATHG